MGTSDDEKQSHSGHWAWAECIGFIAMLVFVVILIYMYNHHGNLPF